MANAYHATFTTCCSVTVCIITTVYRHCALLLQDAIPQVHPTMLLASI